MGSVENPIKTPLSGRRQKLLARGPKLCTNIKSTRLEIVTSVQTISKNVGDQDENYLFEKDLSEICLDR